MVLIDTGGDLYGYQADISRTFTYPIGSYTEEQNAWWTTVQQAQLAALQVRRRLHAQGAHKRERSPGDGPRFGLPRPRPSLRRALPATLMPPPAASSARRRQRTATPRSTTRSPTASATASVCRYAPPPVCIATASRRRRWACADRAIVISAGSCGFAQGHEEVYMVQGNTYPLEPGLCFSVEPGIYIIGRGGVRIEDIVCTTAEAPYYEVFGPLTASLADPFNGH